MGWLFSFGIRGEGLESGDWEESESMGDEEEGDEEEDGGIGRR